MKSKYFCFSRIMEIDDEVFCPSKQVKLNDETVVIKMEDESFTFDFNVAMHIGLLKSLFLDSQGTETEHVFILEKHLFKGRHAEDFHDLMKILSIHATTSFLRTQKECVETEDRKKVLEEQEESLKKIFNGVGDELLQTVANLSSYFDCPGLKPLWTSEIVTRTQKKVEGKTQKELKEMIAKTPDHVKERLYRYYPNMRPIT